jgi:apolipoprotein N-acyltransferase
MPIPVAALLIALPSLLFAASAVLWRYWVREGRLWNAVMTPSCVIAAAGYLVSVTSIHGTAGSVAYTQVEFLPVVQIASLTGIQGVSFVMLLGSSALGVIFVDATLRKRLTVIIPSLVVLCVALGWGTFRSRSGSCEGGKEVTIGLASTSDSRFAFWQKGSGGVDPVAEFSAASENLAANGANIIVNPEKITIIDDRESLDAGKLFGDVAIKWKAYVLTGFARNDIHGKSWNEAVLYMPDGGTLRYEKRHMLPPFESECVVGRDPLTFYDNRGIKVGMAICKDMDFEDTALIYGRLGTDLLLVPALDFVTDGWLHSRMAVFRGVEGGFYIARSSGQGLMTVSDACGRVVSENSSANAGISTLVASVRPKHMRTLYIALGNWFPWTCMAAVAAMFVESFTTRRRGMNKAK